MVWNRSIQALAVVFSLTLYVWALSAQSVTAAPAREVGKTWVEKAFDTGPRSTSVEPVATDDLLRLRDIGGLALSPDGRWLAFSVRQPNPITDEYKVRWFILSTDGSSEPIDLAIDGGQPIPYPGNGYILPEAAKWSPASDQLAFRRRVGERIALVVVDRNTGDAREVFDGVSQVTAFAWSPKGELLFRTGLNLGAFKAEAEREAQHGWLLDGRMALWAAATPSPSPPDCAQDAHARGCDVRTFAMVGNQRFSNASADQSKTLDFNLRPSLRGNEPDRGSVGKIVAGPDDRLVWTESFPPWRPDSSAPMRRIKVDGEASSTCGDPRCEGQFFKEIGWARNGRSVWFIKGGGAASETQSLYEWTPGSRRVRSVTSGTEILSNCVAGGKKLYCIAENWTAPPRIVVIDLDGYEQHILAEPNPEFQLKRFPQIDSVSLRDRDGNLGYAHLVYPASYDPRRKYPLVVVTYISKGFLRGGTGDEYPIYPLSSEGFFVLSVTYPSDIKARRDLAGPEYEKRTRKDQRETSNVVYSIEQAVGLLVEKGMVDEHRVAITGLSFGAAIVHYAMQNSNVFAAAIASTGQGDLTNYSQFPEGALRNKSMALYSETSPLARQGIGEIARLAWSQQPDRLRAPLLLNLHQNEALTGFEGVAVLKAAGRPVEVRVFPNEDHILFHPRSYAGVFDNNVMWLNYWLRDIKNPAVEFHEQYERWDAMRARLRDERRDAGIR